MTAFDFSKIRKDRNKRLGLRGGFSDPITWIDTGNYALNKMISGHFDRGVPLGAVTVFAGESGCLPADATVRVRLDAGMPVNVTVGGLRHLFQRDDIALEIDTPDGWQKIISWWDKGVLPMVVIETVNGLRSVCAHNHLVQRHDSQWVPAGDLHRGDIIRTIDGDKLVTLVGTADDQECYDFEIDHPNHRYWGDGISSHNSGKSYIVSGNIVRDALAKGIYVVLMDTEDALKQTWMRNLGIDTDHPNLTKEVVSTIDEVADVVREFTKHYVEANKDTPREQQNKVLFVVDSLGVVQTQAEIDQFDKNELKGDKGIKAKMLKMLVANCIRLFAGYEIGLVATNHTYKSQDLYSPDDVISGGCLKADTLVHMADGSMRAIEDVHLDDQVKTLFGDASVTHRWNFNKPTYRLELSDGEIIECSPEHKFLVDSDDGQIWRTADDIAEGVNILAF
jgi:hypothetical protein